MRNWQSPRRSQLPGCPSYVRNGRSTSGWLKNATVSAMAICSGFFLGDELEVNFGLPLVLVSIS